MARGQTDRLVEETEKLRQQLRARSLQLGAFAEHLIEEARQLREEIDDEQRDPPEGTGS